MARNNSNQVNGTINADGKTADIRLGLDKGTNNRYAFKYYIDGEELTPAQFSRVSGVLLDMTKQNNQPRY